MSNTQFANRCVQAKSYHRMSDSFISIVPQNVEKTQVKSIADKVINHLVQKGIIKKKLTDCTLGEPGHAPGDNFREALDGDDYGFDKLRTNGLEVITQRHVFHNGGNGLDEIIYPNCCANIIESDWGDKLGEWVNETVEDKITCSQCNATHSVTEYKFEPTWAFGNLGFTFWNWPDLNKGIISEVEDIAGSKVIVIYGRI
jgi:hypothetical protein